jgi:coenzyme PQQ precursor peptide PqqA
MVRGLCAAADDGDHSSRDDSNVSTVTTRRRATRSRSISMQWQTPAAADFRFGFEITMYVAAR